MSGDLTRPLSALAIALAAGILPVAGCSHMTPLGLGRLPVRLPPAGRLGSPITMQVMRSQPPTPAGGCPAGSVALFGADPNVPRAAAASASPVLRPAQPAPGGHQHASQGSPSTSAAGPAPTGAQPAGVACFLPVGTPVTVTSAAVSSVTTSRNQPGPALYMFVVAFPASDVAALTALIRRAYDSGDALGMSVAGQLWQAPQPRHGFLALRAEQISLLSRSQAVKLHRLLVPAG